jgi:hypothetical protein
MQASAAARSARALAVERYVGRLLAAFKEFETDREG